MSTTISNIFWMMRKELRCLFSCRSTYVIVAVFLLLVSYFFFSLLGSLNARINEMATLPFDHPQRHLVNLNQTVIQPYFHTILATFLFLTPIVCMRSFAAEKQSGTFELLMTCPISLNAVVLGKYLGVLGFLGILMAGSFVYPTLLCVLADPEVYPVLVGFLGVLLAVLSFAAIALLCSLVASSQIIAAVSSLLILIFLYGLSVPKEAIGTTQEYLVSLISPVWHVDPFLAGVMTLEGVIYFISVSLIALIGSRLALSEERWRCT